MLNLATRKTQKAEKKTEIIASSLLFVVCPLPPPHLFRKSAPKQVWYPKHLIFLVHRIYDGLLGFGLHSFKRGILFDWFLFSNYFILDHIQVVLQPNWYHGQQTIFPLKIKSTSYPLTENVSHNFQAAKLIQCNYLKIEPVFMIRDNLRGLI